MHMFCQFLVIHICQFLVVNISKKTYKYVLVQKWGSDLKLKSDPLSQVSLFIQTKWSIVNIKLLLYSNCTFYH